MAVTDIASRTYNHGWRLDPIVRSLLDTGVVMPCRITWIRLSGTVLCRLLFSASEGRLPKSGAPPTSWHTAQAP